MLRSKQTLPTSIAIDADELHLWLVDFEAVSRASAIDDYPALLSAKEQQRLLQFRSPKHQQRFLITRAAVRTLLAFYLSDLKPEQLNFTENSFGKPKLANKACQLEFNLSHSHNQLAIGVTSTRLLGVDIEYIDANRNFARIAKHYFHPSEWDPQTLDKYVSTDSDLARYFYKLWTLKEAFIKAEGKGLCIPTDGFYFQKGDSDQPKLVLPSASELVSENWLFQHSFLSCDYSLAVAVEDTHGDNRASIVTRQYVPLHTCSKIDFSS